MSQASEKEATFLSLREVAPCVSELHLGLTIFRFFHNQRPQVACSYCLSLLLGEDSLCEDLT